MTADPMSPMADEGQRLILDDPQGGWWKNTRPDPARRHCSGCVLHIRNLPPDRTVRVTCRCMDQNHGWRTVEGGTWRTTRQQRDIQLVRTTSGPSGCLAQADLP